MWFIKMIDSIGCESLLVELRMGRVYGFEVDRMRLVLLGFEILLIYNF